MFTTTPNAKLYDLSLALLKEWDRSNLLVQYCIVAAIDHSTTRFYANRMKVDACPEFDCILDRLIFLKFHVPERTKAPITRTTSNTILTQREALAPPHRATNCQLARLS